MMFLNTKHQLCTSLIQVRPSKELIGINTQIPKNPSHSLYASSF